MLLNLLDNAVKYGPAGQTITVGSEIVGRPRARSGSRIRVPEFRTMSGSACGSHTSASIATPSRPPAAAASVSSVVRELVTLHGGRTRAESAPGGGARVVIELPLAQPDIDTILADEPIRLHRATQGGSMTYSTTQRQSSLADGHASTDHAANSRSSKTIPISRTASAPASRSKATTSRSPKTARPVSSVRDPGRPIS